MVSVAVGFALGWYAYHFIMNRQIMMRDCCVRHFKTHKRDGNA